MRLSRLGPLYLHARLARNVAIHRIKRLSNVAPTAYVHRAARVSRDLDAADYAFVGHGCRLDPGVHIGRYSMLAAQVAVLGDDHLWKEAGVPIQFAGRPTQSRTFIADDVWIGFRALIMRGVTIGRGAVVAAQAVVTCDVPPYSVVAGVPARPISQRFSDLAERARHDAVLDGPVLPPTFAVPLLES